jgi:Xaa-Pro aminopeptidase
MQRIENVLPNDIERRSMQIIDEELAAMGIALDPALAPVIKRCIHTSADFDYARNLAFSPHALEAGLEALKAGCTIVTDTKMAYSGISKPTLAKLGCQAACFIADEDVAQRAKESGCTRSTICMDKAAEIGFWMHTEARRGCKIGVLEQEIVGRMEGVTYSKGWGPSFTTILSQNGETLHNHSHHQIITPGRLLVVDAGAESNTHYASDFTRTYPCSGKFTTKQREIYDIVQQANDLAFSLTKPGTSYWDVHCATVRYMLEQLKALDFVRGDVDEMVACGISGLFMPHGLGHNMGMDVHDMEDLGENYVGYGDERQRSPLLGMGNLRMARNLKPGHVVTDEPGIYFIPALIEQWKREGTDKGFVNYEKLADYYDFGGIRLEDDVLVTADGARRLGSERLPITSADIETIMAEE